MVTEFPGLMRPGSGVAASQPCPPPLASQMMALWKSAIQSPDLLPESMAKILMPTTSVPWVATNATPLPQSATETAPAFKDGMATGKPSVKAVIPAMMGCEETKVPRLWGIKSAGP